MSVPKRYLEESDALALADQMIDWLKQRLAESGAKRFVLGISGGIDSAVVAGLCARAAGPERVLGVMMPSSSNPDDLVEAEKVVEAFGIRHTTIELTSVTDTFYGSVPGAETLFTDILHEDAGTNLDARFQLATANVRPRLRMMTLYYVANLAQGIVVGTGNKSEAMIGYFTKYGDGGVDIMPLIDLYKYEVRAVASVIGVPESVITRPPSAGLWEGQTDEKEIGLTYDQLDATLAMIEAGDTSAADPAMLKRVEGMSRSSAHKRQPVPQFKRLSQES